MDTKTREERIEELFAQDFCDESHMEAFARALSAVEVEMEENSIPSSPILETFLSQGSHAYNVPRHLQHDRVRKVSALSDFAPIHQKVKRRRKGQKEKTRMNQEPLYRVFRWPLLIILNLIIASEFGLYVLIRQIVNAFEWFLAWRGPKAALRAQLRKARSWDEWKQAASVMDEYLGFNTWKREEEDPYYDFGLVRKVRRSLKSLREKNDARGVLDVLEVCVRDNFAGTESSRLYSETFIGTKDSIEAYVTEVESALAYIRTTPDLSLEEKRRFYRSVNRSLGSSALCFSGGAAFGFYHFGVLKAFLDSNLMPRVFNGTSAGGLSAAFACTHTDEELRLMMGPRLADHITCFEEPFSTTIPRLFSTGALFNTLYWTRKSTFFTRGSMTFREAYERTGKVLNVSVIPSDRHSPTKLLNYLTAPDCVIWSAIIASSAVPTILNPVVLMRKTKSGEVVPWNWGSKFKDGSLRVDVPLQSLNLLFNVNNPIVSQVNPHVHLFFFAPRGSAGKPVAHRKGKGWRGGFLLSAAEQFLKLELTKNFKVIRDLELMPQILGQDWSSVFLQRFEGSVTIHPRTRLMDFFRILSDPDRAEMERMQRAGELATWPKLHLVENRFRLEREIFRGRMTVRQVSLANGARVTDNESRDLPAPDSDPHHPKLEAGLGATEGASSSRVPPPANRSSARTSPAGPQRQRLRLQGLDESERAQLEQLPIESDAEKGFTNRSPRFFRRTHLKPSSSSNKSLSNNTTNDEARRKNRSGSGTPVGNGFKGAEEEDDDDDAPSPPLRARTMSAATFPRSYRQRETAAAASPTSSFISQLRTGSFSRFPRFNSFNRKAASDDSDDEASGQGVSMIREKSMSRSRDEDEYRWTSESDSLGDPAEFDLSASSALEGPARGPREKGAGQDENSLGLSYAAERLGTRDVSSDTPQQDQ